MRCRFCGSKTREEWAKDALDGFVVTRMRRCKRIESHWFMTHEIDDSIAGTVEKFAMNEGRASRFKTIVAQHARDETVYNAVEANMPVKSIAAGQKISPTLVLRIHQRIKMGLEDGRYYSSHEAQAEIKRRTAAKKGSMARGHGAVSGDLINAFPAR